VFSPLGRRLTANVQAIKWLICHGCRHSAMSLLGRAPFPTPFQTPFPPSVACLPNAKHHHNNYGKNSRCQWTHVHFGGGLKGGLSGWLGGWVLSGPKGCPFKMAASSRCSLEAKWVVLFSRRPISPFDVFQIKNRCIQ